MRATAVQLTSAARYASLSLTYDCPPAKAGGFMLSLAYAS